MSSNNTYYVYAYLRENDLTPYYIGKGCGYRITRKHNCSVPKNPDYRVFLKKLLTEQEALDLETRLIKHYGRKDLGTGILRNMTDGGETFPSQKGKKRSDETKAKISAARKGKCSEKQLKKIKENAFKRAGIKRSKTVCEKISNTKKDMVFSQSHREALSKAQTGTKKSEETKEKIKKAMVEKWAQRKTLKS